MEATENVQATDNGIENAETSEEVKEQKRDEGLPENNKPNEAEKEQTRIRRSFSGRRCLSQSVRGRQRQNGY